MNEIVILLSVFIGGGFEGFGLDTGGFGFFLYFQGFNDVRMELEIFPFLSGLDVGLLLFLALDDWLFIAFHFSKLIVF